MDQAAWLARFAQSAEEFRREQRERYARIGAAREGKRELNTVRPAVVLEAAHDVEPDADGVPREARRSLGVALACGWEARLVASLAADPVRGLVAVTTLRFRRHDERGFAAWWNGSYEHGYYWRVGHGLEKLAGSGMATRNKTRATAAVKKGVEWTPVTDRGVLDAIEGRQVGVDLESEPRSAMTKGL